MTTRERILARLAKLRDAADPTFIGPVVYVADLDAAIAEIDAILSEPVTVWVVTQDPDGLSESDVCESQQSAADLITLLDVEYGIKAEITEREVRRG